MKIYLLDPSKEREFKEVSLEELEAARVEMERINFKYRNSYGFNDMILFEVKDGNMYFKIEEYEC